jgi:hypothetical protein
MQLRLVRTVIFGLLSFLALPLEAQEQAETLDLLNDKALSIHITARITHNDEETVWDMELTRVTISGRTVTVRLDGSNIVVIASFTPYREDEDSVLLVAQGQTWISDDDPETDVQYRTSFKSLPISLGEPAVFLPLGSTPLDVTLDSDATGSFNIELEVTVERYVEAPG